MSRAGTGGVGLPTWFWAVATTGVAPYLLAMTVLGRAAQNMGQTTYPLVARQLLGIGNGAVGAMTASAGVVSVVAGTTLAARATARSALGILTAGQAMVATAFALFAVPDGTAGLWAGALVLGVSGGLVLPSTMTMIGSAPAHRRARALAVYALALSAGLVVGPLLESVVLHLGGGSLRGAFATLVPVPVAATALGATAAWRRHATAPRRSTSRPLAVGGTEGRGPVNPAPPGATTSPTAADPATTGPTTTGPTAPRPAPRPPLRTFPAYRLALATMLTYQAPFAGLVTFGALLARRVDGTTAAGASLAFGLFFAVSLAVRTAVVVSPVRHRRAALVFAVIASTAGLAALGSGRGLAHLVVGMAVLGAPHGLTLPLASGVLAEGVPSHVLGRANARLLATTNLVTIAVPFACGWLAGAIGYRAMFLALEVPVAAFGGLLLATLHSGGAGHQGGAVHQAGTVSPGPDLGPGPGTGTGITS